MACKPEFTYSVLPKRIDVQPHGNGKKPNDSRWKTRCNACTKVSEAGMGNYTSPMLLVIRGLARTGASVGCGICAPEHTGRIPVR